MSDIKIKSRKLNLGRVGNEEITTNGRRVKSRKITILQENKSENREMEALKKNRIKNYSMDGTETNHEVNLKKVKARKLNLKEQLRVEEALDREIESKDNLSIAVMFVILAICFLVGIVLGYTLYRIAINSSAMIVTRFVLG